MPSAAPTAVRISAGVHRVEVAAAEGATFRVDGPAHVADVDGVVTVSDVSGRLRVFVGADTEVLIGTTSGRVGVSGPIGHVAIVTESGRVDVESAASADIRSETARVEVGDVTGSCRIRSTSGRVEVRSCGSAEVSADSGQIEMWQVSGEVDAHSVSGRIELSMATANDVRAETVSGRITVSLPKGTVAHRPTAAADRSPRPPGCDCTVVARSTTGKVVVTAR
jgi:hypothetical protein